MSDLNTILLTLLRAGEAAPDLAALDWDALLPAAQRQGVAPLLYYRLQAAGQVQHLPAGAAQTLHLAFHRQWGKNQVRVQTLEHVLGLLAQVGIRPIALKGAGLVLTVYDELAVRPMDDVDLLVAPEEFRPALQQLLAHGGVATHDEPFDGAYELVTHHVALRFPAVSAVVVELHHQWLSLPARQAGLVPFCVTIDQEANAYLPRLFGTQGFALVHRPEQLARALTQVYIRLTASVR